MHYKETDTRNYTSITPLHPDHCKQAIHYSQLLPLRRICSDNDDFAARATETKAFFRAHGYPEALLNDDLCKISSVLRNEALRPPPERDFTESRVPLVLAYNQFNTGTKPGSCLTTLKCCYRTLRHAQFSLSSLWCGMGVTKT